MSDALGRPFILPCGTIIKNRIAKAPMTEGLADSRNCATERHVRLYRTWAEGGAGLLVTGNVQVDRRYMERPGNVAIDGNGGQEQLRRYAEAGTADNTALIMQVSHAGRQTPARICKRPVAPSAVKLALPESAFAPPRALDASEIDDIIARFVHVCRTAKETGFSGVQLHAAHGYLLSEFLSSLVNQRTDQWGGPLENRARLLRTCVQQVRQAVGRHYIISVKLNSSDFQQGGFNDEECLQVVQWLEQDSVDLLEISGGNYESPAMMGVVRDGGEKVKASTVGREAYFLDYAQRIRAVTKMPLAVTGGFRSRKAMEAALASGALDFVGIGRPLCVEPDLPRRLIGGVSDAGGAYERTIVPAKAGLAWFCLQLLRLGDGLAPDVNLTGEQAMSLYLKNEEATAASLQVRAAA